MAQLNFEYYDISDWFKQFEEGTEPASAFEPPPAFPANNHDGLMMTLKALQEAETETMEQGQKEYARAVNVFANFNRIAQDLGLTPEQVLIVYAVKHMDGIISWVNGYRSQREDVTGRIKDLRVYLAILNAMALAYDAEQTTTNPAGFGR